MARRTLSRSKVAQREAGRLDVEAKRREAVAATTTTTTTDSFQNFAARVGLGTDNQSSFSGYGFNPITRNRVMLDFAYRGSWLVRAAVDAIPEDMTREGVEWGSELSPEDAAILTEAFGSANPEAIANLRQTGRGNGLELWLKLREGEKWARLYGGAIAVILIDGQRPDTPLDLERVGENSFLGLEVYDRWQVEPTLNDLVKDLRSPHRGKPQYYKIVSDAAVMPGKMIHHTRVVRFQGEALPYWQAMAENGWGLSVLEPIFSRILAFDSTTQGAAQLVYRAHLRTFKVEKLREILVNVKARDALIEQMTMMRMFQSNEGITLMDTADVFEAHQFTFAGLTELLVNFAQQVAGSLKTPMVRLFGESPVGFNSTGDSDWRNYYDGVRAEQEANLRGPVTLLAHLVARSNGIKLPDGFTFEFTPLWQLTHEQRAAVASQVTSTIAQGLQEGIVTSRATALKELKQLSTYTGVWTNITDEDIKEAELAPPDVGGELGGLGELPGETGGGFLPGGSPVSPGREASLGGAAGETLTDGGERGVANVSFLPGRRRAYDASGASLLGELERYDRTTYGPLTSTFSYPIVIEVRRGERRRDAGPLYPADYGFFDGTLAEDRDPVDVMVGPHDPLSRARVFVIEQLNRDGAVHQHKVMLGYASEDDAERDFDVAWPDRRGDTRTLARDRLRAWLDRYAVGRRLGRAA